MKQKSQSKPKTVESESEHSEEFTIAKIHSQTTHPKIGISYLVEFKGMPDKEHWIWKPENELTNVTGFKKELNKYLKQQAKNKDANGGNSGIGEEKKTSKQTSAKTPSLGEYAMNKQVLMEKIKKAIAQKPNQQQSSLQNFLKPQSKTESPQQPQSSRQQPTLPTKPLTQPPKPSTSIKSQQQSSAQWIQKIKSIKSIKGYEIKNGQMFYEVDVWDKNGQTFFVPPLSSQTVKKIDLTKLAMFLQESMIQEWKEQQKQQYVGMEKE